MRKIMVILVAVLPVLAFMAGCGGGSAEVQNPNEKHIYIHYDDDPWEGVQKSLDRQSQAINDFCKGVKDTADDMYDTTRRMNRNNRETLGILEGARMQDELYRQQQLENMRRAYGH